MEVIKHVKIINNSDYTELIDVINKCAKAYNLHLIPNRTTYGMKISIEGNEESIYGFISDVTLCVSYKLEFL